MSITFTNTAHYGDLFVSRSFIKDISNKIKEDIYYIHKYNKNYLFNDINLKEIQFGQQPIDNKFIFETWYATKNHKYYDKSGCTIQTLYKLFKDVYEELNIKLDNIEKYVPNIDYSKYNFPKEKRNKDTILICTNTPLSGQSNTNDMGYLVNKLSEQMPNKLFFVTNEVANLQKRNNVFYTKDVLKTNNLIELSWFSTQCSSIIGRSSGPYTFSLTKENLEEGLNFFEITYSSPEGDFNLCNFGLPKLGYNNFYNICARCSWDETFNFMEKYHDNL